MSTENDQPTYEWIDAHNARQDSLGRATAGKSSLWGYVPGLVYVGAIGLLSAVLGTEIARLFAGQSVLLQVIGWGCVIVVGMSAIASFYGKGAVYKSARQQGLGKFFWVLELLALTDGLLVAVADSFGYVGPVLDIARFAGFLSVVVAAFGWGIIRWASPEWAVISQQNKTQADLQTKLAELDSQFALSDEMITMRMATARENARRAALAGMGMLLLDKPGKRSTAQNYTEDDTPADDTYTMGDELDYQDLKRKRARARLDLPDDNELSAAYAPIAKSDDGNGTGHAPKA